MWYEIQTSKIGFCWSVTIDRDVAIDHETVFNQSNSIWLVNLILWNVSKMLLNQNTTRAI